jgi:hypothetical protein
MVEHPDAAYQSDLTGIRERPFTYVDKEDEVNKHQGSYICLIVY